MATEEARRSVNVREVFVAGGLPTITYNPRASLALEKRVQDYILERYKVLSVSGPTKSGKTVLLRRVVNGAIWIAGGDLHSLDDFWTTIMDELGLYGEEELRGGTSETTSTSRTGGLSARPLGVGIGGEKSTSTSDTSQDERALTRRRTPRLAAKEALKETRPIVVIDDFHYAPQDLQGEIVRGLKDLVFDGVGVIVAAVPHRSYDPVRVEREMTGRVEQLQIPFWSEDDLLTVAHEGFDALNVTDPDKLSIRLAKESFSSPFLMQDFCLQLVKFNGIEETQPDPRPLREPDWTDFFRERAAAGSKPAFDRLSQGPRTRTDRKPRKLRTGKEVDIYAAVLAAIAHTGPLTELPYVELRSALRDVLDEDPPQQHEVTRVLEQMSRIARDEIEGEPVVDYDSELETLHIADPYFAFYLRWAVRPGI